MRRSIRSVRRGRSPQAIAAWRLRPERRSVPRDDEVGEGEDAEHATRAIPHGPGRTGPRPVPQPSTTGASTTATPPAFRSTVERSSAECPGVRRSRTDGESSAPSQSRESHRRREVVDGPMIVHRRVREERHVQRVVGVMVREDDRRHPSAGPGPSARSGSRSDACDGASPGSTTATSSPSRTSVHVLTNAGPQRALQQDVEARGSRRGCIGHDGSTIAEGPMADARPTISTHVLDLASGSPAAGVGVALFRLADDGSPGAHLGPPDRCRRAHPRPPRRAASSAKATTSSPSTSAATPTIPTPSSRAPRSPCASPMPARSYHVPLLLSPFGMSTYRGS